MSTTAATAVAPPAPQDVAACGTRHIVTCEYPPLVGGVADFTRTIAQELTARGERVHVWALSPGEPRTDECGVEVHPLGGPAPGHLRALERALSTHRGPRRLFVQWVPHGYGYRSLNVAVCGWVWHRARRCGDAVDLMVHEPFLGFSLDPRWASASLVHRAMLAVLCSAAHRIWTSTPAYVARVAPYARRSAPIGWLPVPSPIPRLVSPPQVESLRARLGAPAPLVGHFGTYNRVLAEHLRRVLPLLLHEHPTVRVVLLGRGAEAFAEETLAGITPSLRSRVAALGVLEPEALSLHLQACDVFVQPYPDGVSCRRTTMMALLHHGCAVVTQAGDATEDWWASKRLAELAADDAAIARAALRLVGDARARAALGTRASTAYEERCTPRAAVDALLAPAAPPVSSRAGV